MNLKEVLFIANDPGGYDVVYPVGIQFCLQYLHSDIFLVGPAARLNSAYAVTEQQLWHELKERIRHDLISCVVTGTSWGSEIEQLVIRTCKKANIKTVSILDYWSNYLTRFGQNPVLPDYYIVMDHLAMKEAIDSGVPEQILRVLGHPGLDRYIHASLSSPHRTDKNNKILFLSQPLSHLYGEQLGYTETVAAHDFFSLVCEYPDLEFKIKFHPKDDSSFKKQYASFSVEGDLFELLQSYRMVVGMNSIGLLHAALLGCSILSYQPNLAVDDTSIASRLGLTKTISTVHELKESIHFLKSYHGIYNRRTADISWMDGNSTDRVVRFLLEEVLK
jgi:hypothetical protein